MAMTIDVTALRTPGNLSSAARDRQRATGRRPPGLRITRPDSDVAGLAAAEGVDANAISARRAISEVATIVKQMRELAVQSSETLAPDERVYLLEEFVGLRTELDRIAADTEFDSLPVQANGYDWFDVRPHRSLGGPL